MLQNAASGCEGMNLKSLIRKGMRVRFPLRAPSGHTDTFVSKPAIAAGFFVLSPILDAFGALHGTSGKASS